MLDVFIVEDHELLRNEWLFYLNNSGLRTLGSNCGSGLDDLISEHGIASTVVLDVNLPGENGFSIATRLRKAYPQLGIVMLTGRSNPQDHAKGYEAGVNAYLTKPFPAEHLHAILEAIIQRKSSAVELPWRLNAPSNTLTGPSGLKVALTDNEVAIIEYLARVSNHHASRDDLLLLFNNDNIAHDQAYLHNVVSRLRAKLDQLSDGELTIRTVRNSGYSLLINVSILR